jgi:hypothetical protein
MSVDYSNPMPPDSIPEEEREVAMEFAKMAYRKFSSEDNPGHLLIATYTDPTIVVIAATGEAANMLMEFQKTIPPVAP